VRLEPITAMKSALTFNISDGPEQLNQ
jgi:hypothetical protein